jgi:hypothetical protein
VKEFFNDYKTLKKETEEDNRRWKDSPCIWISRISIMIINIPPKTIYICNAILIKIPVPYTTEIEKSILKFISKPKGLQITKGNLSKMVS